MLMIVERRESSSVSAIQTNKFGQLRIRWSLFLATTLVLFITNMTMETAASTCGTLAVPPVDVAKATCATYSSSLLDGSLSFCNGLVDYPYYLPDGANQTSLDILAQQKVVNGNPQAALLLSIIPPRCANQLKKTVCLAVFQRCEYVDPTYLNSYCQVGEYCGTCGDVTTTNPPQLLPTTTTPSYGSICRKLSDNSPAGSSPVFCAVGPGKVPGLGNIGWELAKTLNGLSISMPEFCALSNLVWSESARSCLAAVPRSPCKGECDKLWTMERTVTAGKLDAVCPLISGNWTLLLNQLQFLDFDPYVTAQAQTALDTMSDDRSTVPLLAAFGLAPNCSEEFPDSSFRLFSNDFTQPFTDGSASVGAGIAYYSGVVGTISGNKCQCVVNQVEFTGLALQEGSNEYCDVTKPANYCNHLATVAATCNSETGSASINPSIGFVGLSDEGMLPQCKKVVTDPRNQPDNTTLQLMQAAFGLPSVEAAMGAFFIPPAPGLPVLATGEMERNLCEFQHPLNPTKKYAGKSSYTCATATVQSAAETLPPIVRASCRAAYLDMLCNMAHMKLEFKSLCLLPNGEPCAPVDVLGAADNKIPFVFALPRFPSRHLCTNFKSECAEVLDYFAGPKGTPQRDLLETTFDCDGQVESTCLKNNAASPWQSTTWECASRLNGQAQFPWLAQPLADINALLGTYGQDNNLDYVTLARLGVSTVANQTISAGKLDPSLDICVCPSPLVAPDDPNAPTDDPLVCCSQRCEGHMFGEDEFNSLVVVQKVVSIMSIIGTSFIILTWSTFKIKRTQPLTLIFAIASFNVSLSFIIPIFSVPDVREVWCRDNTQQRTQEDGGMCIFQAFWITFWVVCACSFWMVQAFDLFLRIVRNRRNTSIYTKYYHLFGWGMPTVIVAIILGTNSGGYHQTYFWCFMAELEDPSLDAGLELGLFYGTIIAIWFFGSVMMLFVLYRIYKITSNANSITVGSKNTAMKRLTTYRTPILFVLFFIYIWASIFAWRFDNEAKKPRIIASGVDWAECLLTNFAAGIADPATNRLANSSLLVDKYGIPPNSGCGDSYPASIAYSDYVYLMCVTGLQGVFVFIIFGAKVENFHLWREKLRLTSKKYDTTADKDKSSSVNELGTVKKTTFFSKTGGSKFTSQSSAPNHDRNEQNGQGSAIMVGGIESGKFMAVSEDTIRDAQVAAYISSE